MDGRSAPAKGMLTRSTRSGGTGASRWPAAGSGTRTNEVVGTCATCAPVPRSMPLGGPSTHSAAFDEVVLGRTGPESYTRDKREGVILGPDVDARLADLG